MPRHQKGSQEAIDHMNKIRGKALVKGSDEAKQHMAELRNRKNKTDKSKTDNCKTD